MRYRGILCAVIGVVTAGLLIPSAHSKSTYWAANAPSCVPLDTTVQSNLMQISGSAVSLTSGETGTVTMYCAVTPNTGGDTTPNRGWLTYKQTGTDGYVKARFYKVSRTTGTITQLFQIDGGTSSTTTETYQIPVGFTLDFNNYYYYYRVDLNRTNTSSVKTFYGVSMGDA